MSPRILLVLPVFLLVTFAAEARRIKGTILFKDDTVSVEFNLPFKLLASHPNYEQIQYRVVYFDHEGVKHVLRPDDAREIDFEMNGEKVRMRSVPDVLDQSMFTSRSNIFLRLEIDGYLKLFDHYFTQYSPGMYNGNTGMYSGGSAYSDSELVLQKGDGPLKQPAGLSFRKDMMEYFADCPDIVDKLQERAFRKSDLEAIVMYYNAHCAPNQ